MGNEDALVVLVGSLPVEGAATLFDMGVKFVWVVDPVDSPPQSHIGAVERFVCPFKSDPESVLALSYPPGISAVLSFTEQGSLPASLLAEKMGLKTVRSSVVALCRDKLAMRRALPSRMNPAFGVIGDEDPCVDDFPVVSKPADGTGSCGVEYLDSEEIYRRRRDALQGAMWESYVDGDEFSVETVSYGSGVHEVLGITRKFTTGIPYFVETAHIAPANISDSVAESIAACVMECLDTLGVDVGACHTEVRVATTGPVIIETHTRPGGDRIPYLTRLVSGRNQYSLALYSVLPSVSVADEMPSYGAVAVQYFDWQGRTLLRLNGVDECREADGVVDVVLSADIGSSIPKWRYSHDRPGYVVVGADAAEQLEVRVRSALDMLDPVFGE